MGVGFRAGKVISGVDEAEVRPGSPRAAQERKRADSQRTDKGGSPGEEGHPYKAA